MVKIYRYRYVRVGTVLPPHRMAYRMLKEYLKLYGPHDYCLARVKLIHTDEEEFIYRVLQDYLDKTIYALWKAMEGEGTRPKYIIVGNTLMQVRRKRVEETRPWPIRRPE